jgi:hypothetical protein
MKKLDHETENATALERELPEWHMGRYKDRMRRPGRIAGGRVRHLDESHKIRAMSMRDRGFEKSS